jgi:hypothetical protein
MFDYTKAEIAKILKHENSFDEKGILIELGESQNIQSDFDKEISISFLAEMIEKFIIKHDIRIVAGSEEFLNCSPATVARIRRGLNVKDSTLMRIFTRIGEVGEVNLD